MSPDSSINSTKIIISPSTAITSPTPTSTILENQSAVSQQNMHQQNHLDIQAQPHPSIHHVHHQSVITSRQQLQQQQSQYYNRKSKNNE